MSAPPSLLSSLPEEQREVFEALGVPVHLGRGRYLVRRGDSGGDLFVVRTGTLEVVDGRQSPELILATLRPGEWIGELSFLDHAPRNADVRAATDAEVLRWPQEDVHALLRKDTAFAAAFWASIAATAARRVRSTTESTSAAFSQVEPLSDGEPLLREARRIAEYLKTTLVQIEQRLRLDGGDAADRDALTALCDRAERDVAALFAGADETRARAAADLLSREWNPYLVRSALAERCLRRPQGTTGAAEVLAHALGDTPQGDGALGVLLDRWLLDRPQFRAVRRVREVVPPLVAEALPTHRHRRILVYGSGTGSLVSRIGAAVAAIPTTITVVDQSRTALSLAEGAAPLGSGVTLQFVHEHLVSLCSRQASQDLPPQDVVVVHALLEYLPDLLAIGLLETARDALDAGGVVVATALAPTADRALVDRLLGWPTIRRTAEGLQPLFRAAGLMPRLQAIDGVLWLASARPVPLTPAPR